MNIKICRTTKVYTSIAVDESNIPKLKKDLESYGYLSEIDVFENINELKNIIKQDETVAAYVFNVVIHEGDYSKACESFDDDSTYTIVEEN